jgi:nickel superoxide dismutase
MIKRYFQVAWVCCVLLATVSFVSAHCEIPCGIYDDEMRFKMISEHILTIEKSMQQIIAIQEKTPVDFHQLARWVVNKEDHAKKIQEIVSRYFMTQRIKPEDKDYAKRISLLHQMLVSAMRCKQTVDLSNAKTLRSLLDEFHQVYFGETRK